MGGQLREAESEQQLPSERVTQVHQNAGPAVLNANGNNWSKQVGGRTASWLAGFSLWSPTRRPIRRSCVRCGIVVSRFTSSDAPFVPTVGGPASHQKGRPVVLMSAGCYGVAPSTV
jgi:hypothetical protein